MPLRFLCPACHQLLSIATRKAGSEVDCPKCRSTIIVPASQDIEEPSAQLFDERGLELALDEIVAGSKPARTAPASYSGAAGGFLRSPGAQRAKAKSIADDLITISRRTLYLQAALLAIVAVVAFVCGYIIGGAK